MVGPLGLGGMTRGLGAPTGAQLGFLGEEEKEKSHIVSDVSLIEGYTQTAMDRAQNLTPVAELIPEYNPANVRQAFSNVGDELGNPEIAKDDAWWKKALGWLEPLKYLDIPAELIVEAATDPISMITGSQMSPIRGSAEREQFEGWKALFSSRDYAEGDGWWDELKARANVSARAFDKRPLKMQLVVGLGQAVATGGAYGIAKGVAMSASAGSKAVLASKALRIGAAIVDPYEIPLRAVGKGIGALKGTVTKRAIIPNADGSSVAPMKELTERAQVTAEEILEASDITDVRNLIDERDLFKHSRANPKFQLDGGLNNIRFDGWIRNDEVLKRTLLRENKDAQDILHPILERGNQIRDFIQDRLEAGMRALDAGETELAVTELGEMAAVQLQLNTAGRSWEIGGVTGKQLFGKGGLMDTGMITLKTTTGKTRAAVPVDANEVFASLRLFKEALEKSGKLNEIMDDRAFSLGRTVKSNGDVMEQILGRHIDTIKSFADMEAYDLRRQKATEMFLEGWEIIDISHLLGHANIDVTRNYIKATMFMGEDSLGASKVFQQMKAGDLKQELTGDELAKYDADVDEVVKSIQANQKAGAKGPGAKGYTQDAAEYDRLSVIEGELYMNTAAGKEIVLGWAKKSGLDNVLEPLLKSGGEAVDESVYDISSAIVSLQGLRDMAMQMKRGYDAADFQRNAINKINSNIDNMLKEVSTRDTAGVTNFNITNKSMLERAGFAINKEGKLDWLALSDDAKVRNWWGGEHRFLAFADESGLGSIFGKNLNDPKVVKRWTDWAGEMMAEQTAMGAILEKGTIKHGKKNYIKHNLLLNYVDVKAWELYREWASLEGIGKGTFGVDLTKAEVARVAIQRQIDELRYNPVGQMAKDEAMQKQFHRGYAQGKKLVIQRAKASSALDGTTKEGGVFFKNGNPVRNWGDAQLQSLKTWLEEPDVRGLFAASGINHNSSVKSIKNMVKLIAKNNPNMLGSGFAKFIKLGASSQVVEKWVDEFASRLANHRELWEGINNIAHYNYDELSQKLKVLDPGRKRLDFVPETVNGVGSELVAGVFLTIRNMVEKIKGPDELKWFHKDTLVGKAFRNIVGPVVSGVMGGQATIARPIVKAIGGRARLYHDAGRQGAVVQAHVQKVAEDTLGLQVETAHEGLIRAGINEGQEFFTKLEVRPADKIREFEEGAEALQKYKTNGTVLRKLSGVTREGSAGTERVLSDSQALKYLTQVDIVMERINPEDWDKYFVLSQTQKDTLAHLKDVLFQVDEQARMRGVDIVGTILDKGGEYLTNYMPRLYRKGTKWDSRARANAKRGDQGVLNSYANFFEPREQKDIIDVLAQGMEPGVATNITRLQSSILESFSARMGQYVETMWKTAIDTETAEYLVKSPQMKEAMGAKYANEVRDLNNLERILNERSATTGVIDAERIASLRASELTLDGVAIKRYAESLVVEGESSLANARAIRNNIMEKIVQRRDEISLNWSNTAGKELDGIDWLPTSLNALDAADQRALAQHLDVIAGIMSPVGKLAKIMQSPTRYMRYFKASMDFGAPMIHGFNALIRMPNLVRLAKGDVKGGFASQQAWLKGVGQMGRFFFSPDTYRDYITNADNMRVMHEAKDFIRLGHAEPLVGMDDADLLRATRAYVKRKMEPQFGKHAAFLQRFEDSFTGYLDVLRTELWKAMKPTVDDALRKNGVKELTIDNALVRQQYTDLGTVINKMTGVYDPELSLRTPFQGLIETSLLFFAPIYRRATYGIIADLFLKIGTKGRQDRGGQKWRSSFQQLTGLALAGLMMGELAEATGNTRGDFFDSDQDLKIADEDGNFALDLTARFGKFHTHGVQIGIGTAWWTAFRMASDIAMHNPFDNTTLNKQDNNDAWHQHWALKMLQQRGRSQLAPGSGMAIDIFTGRTFTGDPLRDGTENDWGATLARMGQAGVPFWLDGALSSNPIASVGVTMAAEFFGFQSFEISSYDKLSRARIFALRNWESKEVRDWREERIRNNQPVNWVSAPESIKRIINEENGVVAGLLADHREEYGAKAFGDAQLFREYNEIKSASTLSAVKAMAEASRQFERGEITARDLTEVIGRANYIRYETNNNLLTQVPKFKAIQEYFIESRLNIDSATDVSGEFVGDIIYEKYMAVMWDVNPETGKSMYEDPVTGEFNWEARKAAEDAFFETDNNAEFKDYINKRRRDWLKELPTINAFENAKEALRSSGYWDIENKLFAHDDKMRTKARRFLRANSIVREAYKASDPDYNYIEKRVAQEREYIRRSNADIDRILVTWYNNEPMHPLNMNLKAQLQEVRLNGREVTASPDRYQVSPTGRITAIH